MLTCYLIRRRLGAYVDGGLEAPAARGASRHLEACRRCQAEVESLRRLRGLVREGLALSAPSDWSGFWPGVVRGIEDARRVAPAPGGPLPVLSRVLARPRLALGGALAAVLALSLTLWQALDSGLAPPGTTPAVVSANTELPDATVLVYSVPEQQLAVVWVLGAD